MTTPITMTLEQIAPACPVCGEPMRIQGRGATLAKHGPRWVCPVAVAEVAVDAKGHLHRQRDARHTTTRVWSDDELQQETRR